MVSTNPLTFSIGSCHQARQLCLTRDLVALAVLAVQCRDYLRFATERAVSAASAPRLLLSMLRPGLVPAERSYVLGIYPTDRSALPSDALQGVLYFLHPPAGSFTWYLTLLLLQPEARGQGLGAEVHRAFALWAGARGSRRFVVAVARDNFRAQRFWRHHLRYGDAPGLPSVPCVTKPHHQNLERHLDAPTFRGWQAA